jgi:ABC-type Zn uptake system ZnuABC Zn-binding protein ZnuA
LINTTTEIKLNFFVWQKTNSIFILQEAIAHVTILVNFSFDSSVNASCGPRLLMSPSVYVWEQLTSAATEQTRAKRPGASNRLSAMVKMFPPSLFISIAFDFKGRCVNVKEHDSNTKGRGGFVDCLTVAPSPGLSDKRDAASDPSDRLKIVTTVAPITSIVENVGGDKSIAKYSEGISSHLRHPSDSNCSQRRSGDPQRTRPRTPTLKLAQANLKQGASIFSLGDKTIKEAEYVYDFSFPKEQGHPNPHLWLNPEYAMRYATLARDELARLDPKNKAVYEQNAAQYLKKLEALDRAIKEALQTIPQNNRRLLTYHDSWPYFARRYGFQVIGAVQPSDFADPSPKEVVRLIEQIRKEKVPAVFGSEVFPSPVLEQIAREGKSRYIDKLRDDELPGKPGDPRHSYIGMMVENMTIMFEALGGFADLNGPVRIFPSCPPKAQSGEADGAFP